MIAATHGRSPRLLVCLYCHARASHTWRYFSHLAGRRQRFYFGVCEQHAEAGATRATQLQAERIGGQS